MLKIVKNTILLLIGIVTVALLIWLTIHLYLGYMEYKQPLTVKNSIETIPLFQYVPQTGDIVLFVNEKKPVLFMKHLCSSKFTHVGIVYCTTENNLPKSCIIETDIYLGKVINPLDERIRWYQQHRGQVFIRRLTRPLTMEQLKKCDDLIYSLQSTNQLKYEYLENMNQKTDFRISLPLYFKFISTYALKQPKPLSSTQENILCTDFVLYVLYTIFESEIASQELHGCLKPKFFENYNEFSTLFPNKYESSLYHLE